MRRTYSIVNIDTKQIILSGITKKEVDFHFMGIVYGPEYRYVPDNELEILIQEGKFTR